MSHDGNGNRKLRVQQQAMATAIATRRDTSLFGSRVVDAVYSQLKPQSR